MNRRWTAFHDTAVSLSETFGWLNYVDPKIVESYKELRAAERQRIAAAPPRVGNVELFTTLARGVRTVFVGGTAVVAVIFVIVLVGAALLPTIIPGVIGTPGGIGGPGTIEIPGVTAMQRSRQKRTMADLRSVAAAIDAYATDNNGYPPTPPSHLVADIEKHLSPTYIRRLPTTDGWGGPIFYYSWHDGAGSEEPTRTSTAQPELLPNHYALVATGKDRVRQPWGDLKTAPPAQTTSIDDDMVFRDGNFIRYPEGIQVQ